MSVKSMVLRVAKIEHFIVSLYTIKRKRNIFKIYAYMIVKSMVLEKYKKWLIYSFYISIHNKKNGSSILKPNKIKGFRVF